MTKRLNFRGLVGAVALGAMAAACGGSGSHSDKNVVPGGPENPDKPLVPGTHVVTHPRPETESQMLDIEKKLKAVESLDADGFVQMYGVPFNDALGYDATTAAGLDLIQASSLGLDDDEQALLASNGFVLSEKKTFPTFVYGYQTIYMEDLPLYVSADSVLHAVHRSYDEILKQIELAVLIPELGAMLESMRGALSAGAASSLGSTAQADADVYLTVASGLLAGAMAQPSAGGDPAEVQKLYAGAMAEDGWKKTELFGVERNVDFSQFKPRGHYTETEGLKNYFRAMMWLGRIDLRLIETQPDHTQKFHRRQLEGALALQAVMDGEAKARWSQIDSTIGAFVGEHDSMTVDQLDSLLADLGATAGSDLASMSDDTIAQAIIDGGYGTQRISSHIMINGLNRGTMPLSSAFLLFGQRYVVDSHVFSNVVYDRVQGGAVKRMMPSTLDAAFAAFGNNQAGQLLKPELSSYGYAPDLASMRILVDEHPESYWDANLYNLWLGAIRTLSPGPDVADPQGVGLPTVAGTEAWGRRMLSAQMASWAELRHDTLLYAKQSYTGGAACEFPDAYVDPYPAFYARIADFALLGKGLVGSLDLSNAPWLVDSVGRYFDEVHTVATTLGSMAEHQRSGAPFNQEQMDFINEAVVVDQGCGEPTGATGWYPRLFFSSADAIEYDPTIADVHTQPTDASGNPVGRVLHVGTGSPRLMVVTASTCTGPRAYAGLVSSYFEQITRDFERLDDETWATSLNAATPADVPWMESLVAR